MKTTLILLSALLVLQAGISSAQAQELRSEGLVNLNMKSFRVHEVRHVSLGGEAYTRVDYRLKAEADTGFQPEPLLLALQGVVLPAALTETFQWRTPKGVHRASWMPADDKMKHLFAGFFIGDATNLALQLLIPEDVPHRRWIASLSGFGAAAVVGVVKELRDARGYGTPDPKDALATAIGGALGTISMSFDVKKVFRPKGTTQERVLSGVRF